MGIIVVLIIVASSVARPAAIPPIRFRIAFSAVSNLSLDAPSPLLDLKIAAPEPIPLLDCG